MMFQERESPSFRCTSSLHSESKPFRVLEFFLFCQRSNAECDMETKGLSTVPEVRRVPIRARIHSADSRRSSHSELVVAGEDRLHEDDQSFQKGVDLQNEASGTWGEVVDGERVNDLLDLNVSVLFHKDVVSWFFNKFLWSQILSQRHMNRVGALEAQMKRANTLSILSKLCD